MATLAPDYSIQQDGNRHASRNAEQGLAVQYSDAGFELEVGEGISLYRASFLLQGIGCGAAELTPEKQGIVVASGNELNVDHGSFRMVYENGPEGMRHDLVVQRKPAGTGVLEARFRLGGDLLAMQEGPDEMVFHSVDSAVGGCTPRIRYNGLKAWDSSGRQLRAFMALRGDCIVLSVDDAGAAYPVTIDPLSSTADLDVSGSQTGENYGYSVATAGDVNGDGYSDIIVGAPNWNVPLANAGRAMIFLGSASGLASTPAWTVQGTNANARLGTSVSSAGDLNGDGISDVVVGAPGYSGYGAALVYFGAAPGGPSTVAAAVWKGDSQVGCDFGWSVALAGDVNGDNRSDVIVGAPKYTGIGASSGKAYCYHGAGALPSVAAWAQAGASAGDQFGYSVAGAGDLNGDGWSDVAVGAPYQNGIGPVVPTGYVYVYKGVSGTGLSAVASSSVTQGGNGYNFGYCVAGAGDMDGDGYADLIIGAPGRGAGQGAAYIYRGDPGAGLLNATVASAFGSMAGERFGQSVSTAGDANGDGYADVAIGSPLYSSSKGRVRVFLGGSTIALNVASPYWAFTGATANDLAGAAVCTAGDVNGDGFSDMAVGVPGQGGIGSVKAFHGTADKPSATPQWTIMDGSGLGGGVTCVATAGDVNGDGYSDVLVGSPWGSTNVGQVMLYLGTPTGLSATPAWTKLAENTGDLFGASVATAGDVNGDGYSDVLVGAPGWPNYTWQGKAYLYLGSAGGLAATPAWTAVGEALDARLGYSVSTAGDVNGDGYSDVILGSYNFKSGAITVGKAYVYHGVSGGLAAAPAWSSLGESVVNGEYGMSVSLAGDVNGDGYDDVLIGDPYYDRPVGASFDHNIGAAYLFLGSAAGVAPVYTWRALGEQAGVEFGCSVSFAGDVNGDGYSDAIVGAYRQPVAGKSQAGRAYVYQGTAHYNPGPVLPPGDLGGLSVAPATVLEDPSPDTDQELGYAVCSAGDVDGDGFSDVVVGVPGYSFYALKQGKAMVYRGSASGVQTTVYWSAIRAVGSSRPNARSGSSVALAGDVNGDGYSDIAVGANETDAAYNHYSADLYLGNGGRALPMRTFQFRSNLTTLVRTSNGTFQSDCQWGIGQYARSSMGRSKVKLAWDVFGHGPWNPTLIFNNNSTAFTGQDASYFDAGLPPSGLLLKRVLSTVSPATSHPAWRSRVRHHPATALDGRVFGRWFVQGMHDMQVPGIKTDLAGCGPLPVTLLGSSVQCVDGQAVLQWSTASEQDCAEFVVQRSKDGGQWEAVGSVPCSGNSAQVRNYRFVDAASLGEGISYYRLRQVDINGSNELFPAMVLEPCGIHGRLAVWPNPFEDILHIGLPAGYRTDGTMLAVMHDPAGREVLRRSVQVDGEAVLLSGCTQLAPGAYWLQLQAPGGDALGQVLVVRK